MKKAYIYAKVPYCQIFFLPGISAMPIYSNGLSNYLKDMIHVLSQALNYKTFHLRVLAKCT